MAPQDVVRGGPRSLQQDNLRSKQRPIWRAQWIELQDQRPNSIRPTLSDGPVHRIFHERQKQSLHVSTQLVFIRCRGGWVDISVGIGSEQQRQFRGVVCALPWQGRNVAEIGVVGIAVSDDADSVSGRYLFHLQKLGGLCDEIGLSNLIQWRWTRAGPFDNDCALVGAGAQDRRLDWKGKGQKSGI